MNAVTLAVSPHVDIPSCSPPMASPFELQPPNFMRPEAQRLPPNATIIPEARMLQASASTQAVAPPPRSVIQPPEVLQNPPDAPPAPAVAIVTPAPAPSQHPCTSNMHQDPANHVRSCSSTHRCSSSVITASKPQTLPEPSTSSREVYPVATASQRCREILMFVQCCTPLQLMRTLNLFPYPQELLVALSECCNHALLLDQQGTGIPGSTSAPHAPPAPVSACAMHSICCKQKAGAIATEPYIVESANMHAAAAAAAVTQIPLMLMALLHHGQSSSLSSAPSGQTHASSS